MKINILGQDYKVVFETESENPKLKNANGLCEAYAKEIVINKDVAKDKMAYKNIELFMQNVLRHETIHAFLFECGQSDYCEDESLVETLAQLIPKISKIFNTVDLKEFNDNLKEGD